MTLVATWTKRCVVSDPHELHEPEKPPQTPDPDAPSPRHSQPTVVVTAACSVLGRAAATAAWMPPSSVGNVMAYCPPARTATLSWGYCSMDRPTSNANNSSASTIVATNPNSNAAAPRQSLNTRFFDDRKAQMSMRSPTEIRGLSFRHHRAIRVAARCEAGLAGLVQIDGVGNQNGTRRNRLASVIDCRAGKIDARR